MKKVICEHGINDMPIGWHKENKWNEMVYRKWKSMTERVYSERIHNNRPTYINVTLQLELHWLSYFVEHITEIDGYDEEKFLNGELELDKDIKSNEKNKEYSLENCKFVTKKENTVQSHKNRQYTHGENHPLYGKEKTDKHKQKISNSRKEKGVAKGKKNPNYGNHKLSGENNPRARKVIQYDYQMNSIKIWDFMKQASEELNINLSHISECCKKKRKHAGKDENGNGFVWRYYEEGKHEKE